MATTMYTICKGPFSRRIIGFARDLPRLDTSLTRRICDVRAYATSSGTQSDVLGQYKVPNAIHGTQTRINGTDGGTARVHDARYNHKLSKNTRELDGKGTDRANSSPQTPALHKKVPNATHGTQTRINGTDGTTARVHGARYKHKPSKTTREPDGKGTGRASSSPQTAALHNKVPNATHGTQTQINGTDGTTARMHDARYKHKLSKNTREPDGKGTDRASSSPQTAALHTKPPKSRAGNRHKHGQTKVKSAQQPAKGAKRIRQHKETGLVGDKSPYNEKLGVQRLAQDAKRTSNYKEAALVVDQLLYAKQLSPSDGEYAMSIYKENRQPDRCLSLLKYHRAKGDTLTANHYNPCISALSASRRYATAYAVFGDMRVRGVTPDRITWTTVMQMLIKAGKAEEAVVLFQDMIADGFSPDARMYVVAMTAYKKLDRWIDALQLFSEMESRGIPGNSITYSAAISACESGGQSEKAEELFYEMGRKGIERTTGTYNTMISACEKRGEYKRAMNLFNEMMPSGIAPNTTTYNTIISTCGARKNARKAIELFDEMERKGIKRDTITYNTMISVCVKGEMANKALELFEEMGATGCVRDTITYNVILSACQKSSHFEKAMEVFDEMDRKDVKRDTITYTTAISACEDETQWSKAIELFDEMARTGIVRNTRTYSAIISACARVGKSEKAVELLCEMECEGVEINTFTYSAAITACEKGKDWMKAIEIFDQMQIKGIERDTGVYNAVMQALGTISSGHTHIDSLYEDMIKRFALYGSCWNTFDKVGVLDLHNHTQLQAQAAVRRLLRILQTLHGDAQEGTRPPSARIIVGEGKNSADGLVLDKAVRAVLESLNPPISTQLRSTNTGELVFCENDLKTWLVKQRRDQIADVRKSAIAS